MCLRLYEYAYNHGKLELAPVLAAAPAAISADKLSYTIRLRQGILFNDGTPFNAQAVVTTYQRYITYPGSLSSGDFAGVDSVTASGPYTVVYPPEAARLDLQREHVRALADRARQEGANFAANPICVSPFMFDHRVVGDDVTLVKSPYYYKRSAVHLDKIVFKPMPDAAAAVAALQAGDIQLSRSSRRCCRPCGRTRACACSRPQFTWAGIMINIGNRSGPATCRTRTRARRSRRARRCGRHSRRRSTAPR